MVTEERGFGPLAAQKALQSFIINNNCSPALFPDDVSGRRLTLQPGMTARNRGQVARPPAAAGSLRARMDKAHFPRSPACAARPPPASLSWPLQATEVVPPWPGQHFRISSRQTLGGDGARGNTIVIQRRQPRPPWRASCLLSRQRLNACGTQRSFGDSPSDRGGEVSAGERDARGWCKVQA